MQFHDLLHPGHIVPVRVEQARHYRQRIVVAVLRLIESQSFRIQLSGHGQFELLVAGFEELGLNIQRNARDLIAREDRFLDFFFGRFGRIDCMPGSPVAAASLDGQMG